MTQPEVTRDELIRLENRVTAVEQEVDGEKTLSRFILNQSRLNGDDLAVVKTQLDRVEAELVSLRSEFSSLRTEVSSLKRELPTIVSTAVRDVLGGR